MSKFSTPHKPRYPPASKVIPVVGHGDRLLPQRGHPVNKFGQVANPIQQRVLGMQMQMRKFGHG